MINIPHPNRMTLLQVDVLARKWLHDIQFDSSLSSEDKAARKKVMDEFVAWFQKQIL